MPTFNLKYDKLFSIALTHPRFPSATHAHSWLSPLSALLDITPDGTTRNLFQKHDIHVRFEQDVLTCYIRVDATGRKPFHMLPKDFRMRFLVHAQPAFLSKTTVSAEWGRERIYHVRVRLKTTSVSEKIDESLLGVVDAIEPQRIYHRGNGDGTGHWELVPVRVKDCFAVIDMVPEGSRRNRLFANEAQQVLYFTKANNKQHEHLYELALN